MSISSRLIRLNEESENYLNNSIIDDEIDNAFGESGFDGFGSIKTSLPTTYGLDNAIQHDDEFVDAIDGQDNEVNLSFHDSYPNESFEFEEDANLDILGEEFSEDIPIDPNTIVPHPDEEDQWEDEDNEYYGTISDEELASDDGIEESFTAWDDLI